jgi:LmbE family N-acetylglucosaminyl deacetylase
MSFRAHLRSVKRAAGEFSEPCWNLAATLGALILRPTASSFTSPGQERALVIAAHPDDEAAGCAGTILRHRQAGDDVSIAIVTDGRLSRAIADPEAMAVARRREAEHAASLMGVDRLEWLGFKEGAWATSGLVPRLGALLERLLPDVVYAPSRIDFHPQHLAVAHALALALMGIPSHVPAPTIRVYAIQVPLTPILSNLVVDVSLVRRRCDAILRAYGSQTRSLECTRRMRGYSARGHGAAGYAEEFWEISTRQYVALHREPPRQWPTPFRGLRNSPLSDPLAYLIGTRERLRIREDGSSAEML